MLIKFTNNLLSIALFLMSYQLMVWTAVLKPANNLQTSHPNKDINPEPAANHPHEFVIPILSSAPQHNPEVPYFEDSPNYPHVQLHQYNEDTETIQPTPDPLLRRVDQLNNNLRLASNDEPDYYYDPAPNYNRGPDPPRDKPKKLYKAIERVYFYPQDETNHEPTKNKMSMNEMKKEFMPDSYEPYYHEEDPNDQVDSKEEYEDRHRKDLRQMDRNPANNDDQPNSDEPEQFYNAEQDEGMQKSIAEDVKDFGKEAVDETNRFDKFLDNLRNFATNSEKEYSSPKENDESNGDSNDSDVRDSDDGTNYGERIDPNPTYSESLAAQSGPDQQEDRTRDYDRVEDYGNPDEYDPQRKSYEKQNAGNNQMGREGHRYHKDRRRPRKPVVNPDENYEQRNHEVSGLIDSEPDESDYLSNYDVVKQMKNSEQKYNTGVDPVYSSKRDFDEVKRLEKMIENVALLNKQKEMKAAEQHENNSSNDNTDNSEGSESKITNIKTKTGSKTKSKSNKTKKT